MNQNNNNEMTRIISVVVFLFLIASCNSPHIEDSKLMATTLPQKNTKNEVLHNEAVEYDIDNRFDRCVQENSCSVCFEECSVRAIKEWRDEMNKYYSLLLDSLDKTSKEKLISAQKKWLEFSELELQFSNEFYGNMDGTIWNGVGLGQSKEKIKSRALNLKAHYEAITGDAIR